MNISEYLDDLNIHYKSGITSKQTYFNNFQTLLKSFDIKLKSTNDPVYVACGAPNYIITKNHIPLGFINTENLGEDLKSKLLIDKLNRFIGSINNFIFTNFLDFYFYADGELKASIRIAEIQNTRLIPLPENFNNFISIFKDFSTHSGQLIKNTSKLAGITENWGISFDKNDQIINEYLWNIAYKDRENNTNNPRPNIEALKMFIERSHDTKHLCDGIWKLEEGYCAELKIFFGIGILNGESSQVTGRKIRQYLENPEALFRRIRDKDGNLILDKTQKEDTLNNQKIKSAYENAAMLMASLTNQSYLLADYERWLKLDMVLGVKISLSGQHKQHDICDDLQGVYPKTFVFSGWHFCCHCYITPVLTPEEDFRAYLRGEKKLDPVHITKMPDNFIKYIEVNKEQIANMNDKPDWIKYNFENGNKKKAL